MLTTLNINMHLPWIFGMVCIILYSITILGLIVVILTENRNPLKTIAWVVVLLLAPGIGLLFYVLFGQDNRKQRIISRRTYKIGRASGRERVPSPV